MARQVQQLLPGEDIIYFGDGAHIPYGNHPRQRIIDLARYMFEFMEQRKVKALMIACNTISCLVESCEDAVSCPVFNAVQAGANAASGLNVEKVGVISTVFTHNSRCYPTKIQQQNPRKLVVLSCGCPDLARLVEHNLGDPAGMAEVEENLHLELKDMVAEGIECLVLGCTHYPLVEDRIHKLYPQLELIDPARQMALEVAEYLKKNDLSAHQGCDGTLRIYTTGDVEEYAVRAQQVGLKRVKEVLGWPAAKI